MLSRMFVGVVLVALGAGLPGCSEPLEFADWTIPVPEATRIIDYAAVPVEARTEQIVVEERSRVGAGEDIRYSFYHPSDLAVADDGRLYVLDAGNHRIQVFDSAGTYRTSIGGEGDGPGEMRRGGELALGADTLVRVGDGRISSWTLDGELISDSAIVDGASPRSVAGLPDGSVVAMFQAPAADGDSMMITSFVRLDAGGEQRRVYARLRGARRTLTLLSAAGMTIVDLPTPAPGAAVSRRGEVYLTNADEYQILAMDAGGEARWALRTAWPRPPMSAVDRDRAVARRVAETATEDLDVAWPTHNPALANGRAGEAALHVDGHGHLYVFPFVRSEDTEAEQAPGPWPVDVYAADGARLFSGLVGVSGWWGAAGDFIYRFENDAATEEQVVVRFRLVEPFERP